jgi:hypothetical protein
MATSKPRSAQAREDVAALPGSRSTIRLPSLGIVYGRPLHTNPMRLPSADQLGAPTTPRCCQTVWWFPVARSSVRMAAPFPDASVTSSCDRSGDQSRTFSEGVPWVSCLIEPVCPQHEDLARPVAVRPRGEGNHRIGRRDGMPRRRPDVAACGDDQCHRGRHEHHTGNQRSDHQLGRKYARSSGTARCAPDVLAGDAPADRTARPLDVRRVRRRGGRPGRPSGAGLDDAGGPWHLRIWDYRPGDDHAADALTPKQRRIWRTHLNGTVTPGGFLVLSASPPLVLGKATTTNWGPRPAVLRQPAVPRQGLRAYVAGDAPFVRLARRTLRAGS